MEKDNPTFYLIEEFIDDFNLMLETDPTLIFNKMLEEDKKESTPFLSEQDREEFEESIKLILNEPKENQKVCMFCKKPNHNGTCREMFSKTRIYK